MGNMYMADPIRPEDLNSSSILGGGSNKWNSHNNQNNQKNNNSTNKVIATIIIIFFALPFAAFISLSSLPGMHIKTRHLMILAEIFLMCRLAIMN